MSESESPGRSQPVVVCVDDNPQLLLMQERWLTERGFLAHTCGTAMEFMRLLEHEQPDIILLDVKMPGSSGIEVLRELRGRAATRYTPVLMVSANDTEEQITSALASGANDFLIKPVTAAELIAKINHHLQRAQTPRPQEGEIDGDTVFGGRYQVQALLWEGTGSTVYRGVDLRDGDRRAVAIKVLNSGNGERRDPRALQVFTREVTEQARLDHPNVAALLDFGQRGDRFYLVMEYVVGHSLARIQERVGCLSESMAVGIGQQVAEALKHFAEHGVVHRDIRPANLMLSTTGQVKVIDFGLAQQPMDQTLGVCDRDAEAARYLAPEVVMSLPTLDVRADIYSLGVTLFMLTTGSYPFSGGSLGVALQAAMQDAPMRLRALKPTLSEGFDELVDRMLAREPATRLDVDALIAALAPLSA